MMRAGHSRSSGVGIVGVVVGVLGVVGVVGVAGVAGILGGAGCHKEHAAPSAALPGSPPPTSAADRERLARGEYVAALSGCVICHTPMQNGAPDRTRLLAGGLEEKVGRGVWRSPNITPDRATGIGMWTDAQIITAIRVGLRPDGKALLPIMPYPFFHAMTDDDARAVVAYLRAQRPIAHEVRRSEGIDLRPVELPQPVGNVDRTDDPKAHGEYLASLMHCGACHTPQQGPRAGTLLAGGTPFELPGGRTIYSANITSDRDTGIGTWTEDQVIATLRTMRTPSGQPIEGPMSFYAEAWARLTERDARALAVYVKTIPPVRNAIGESERAARR